MALFLQEQAAGTHWGVWKMEESLDELLALLSDAQRSTYRQGLARFTSDRRKQEWLCVRVLLHTLLPDKEKANIAYTEEGKPFLADHSRFISISHTKGYAAVILSTSSPVGIDIEKYGPRVHRVAERFVRPDEEIIPYQDDDTWSLLLHWSAKETVFKRMENPDADLRKLRVMPFVPQERGTFRLQEMITERQEVYEIGYRLLLDAVLTYTI
ncbi:MAG: 4'-phosphopantetheinyl transferase superfamily protein [Mediterranea sp.]|jgi:phosphopantetheinyl transferase|nr:4'-phosphopantetheinyl transferase superfamily protein [Mediterranea sp.]